MIRVKEFLLVGALFFVGSPAWAANWTYIVTFPGLLTLYFDQSSIQKTGNHVKLWKKEEFFSPFNSHENLFSGAKTVVRFVDIDCVNRVWRQGNAHFYNASGALLYTDSRFSEVAPIREKTAPSMAAQRFCG